MSNITLNNLLNLLKVYAQNKASVLKIRFSKKHIKVLKTLFKEGFIRGYYVVYENQVNTIYVLLKHTHNGQSPFKYKIIKFTEQCKYKSKNNDFNFFMLSNIDYAVLTKNKTKFQIGGEPVIKVY